MSEEQLKAFWEAVQADTALQEKLSAATDADAVVSIAKEAGFEITAEEVKEAQAELSQESLKDVVGGVDKAAKFSPWTVCCYDPEDEPLTFVGEKGENKLYASGRTRDGLDDGTGASK